MGTTLKDGLTALIEHGLTFADAVDAFQAHDPGWMPLGTLLNKLSGAHGDVEKAYVKAAQRLKVRDGELEVDDNAVVSMGDDPGAYVLAWVWVDAKAAGIKVNEEALAGEGA